MGKVIATGVTPEFASAHAARLEEILSVALPYGEVEPKQIIDGLPSGRYQMWLVSNDNEIVAVAVTEVVSYPARSALRIVALSGTGFDNWGLVLSELLESFARCVNAKHIEAIGRRGLERLLKPLGYEARYVVVAKELNYGENGRYN